MKPDLIHALSEFDFAVMLDGPEQNYITTVGSLRFSHNEMHSRLENRFLIYACLWVSPVISVPPNFDLPIPELESDVDSFLSAVRVHRCYISPYPLFPGRIKILRLSVAKFDYWVVVQNSAITRIFQFFKFFWGSGSRLELLHLGGWKTPIESPFGKVKGGLRFGYVPKLEQLDVPRRIRRR